MTKVAQHLVQRQTLVRKQRMPRRHRYHHGIAPRGQGDHPIVHLRRLREQQPVGSAPRRCGPLEEILTTMKAKTKKTTKFTAEYLDKLIEDATTDAYDESEQAGGFFAMIEENLSLPFTTRVLGQEVTVARVDLTRRDQIVAICVYGKSTQAIAILDLPMPDPPPEGAEWIEAYRRWCGN